MGLVEQCPSALFSEEQQEAMIDELLDMMPHLGLCYEGALSGDHDQNISRHPRSIVRAGRGGASGGRAPGNRGACGGGIYIKMCKVSSNRYRFFKKFSHCLEHNSRI